MERVSAGIVVALHGLLRTVRTAGPGMPNFAANILKFHLMQLLVGHLFICQVMFWNINHQFSK